MWFEILSVKTNRIYGIAIRDEILSLKPTVCNYPEMKFSIPN